MPAVSSGFEPTERQSRWDEEDALLRRFVIAREAGDVEEMRDTAARFVYGRYGQLVAFARVRLPDGHVAEDVVGDAILSALDSLGPERPGFAGSEPGELGAWLFQILKRRIVDYFRREERQIKGTSLDADSRDEGDGPGAAPPEPRALTADPAAEVPIHDAHDRVVEGLSSAHRKVINLWWRERLPASEIIERLREQAEPGVDAALTVDNVHQIISRYRAKMRKILEVEG